MCLQYFVFISHNIEKKKKAYQISQAARKTLMFVRNDYLIYLSKERNERGKKLTSDHVLLSLSSAIKSLL